MTNNKVKESFFELALREETRLRSLGYKVTQTDIRTMFCEYIDMLCKDGQITEEQAQKLSL